jgi:hypothetical protein
MGWSGFNPLQPCGGKPFQPLGARIHFDADGFKGRDSEDGLRIVRPENDRRTGDLSHEFQFARGDRHANFTAIRELIGPLGFGR